MGCGAIVCGGGGHVIGSLSHGDESLAPLFFAPQTAQARSQRGVHVPEVPPSVAAVPGANTTQLQEHLTHGFIKVCALAIRLLSHLLVF